MTEEEARERLAEIEESLAKIEKSPAISGLRNTPDPETLTGQLLHVLYEDGGWMTAAKLEQHTSRNGVTRALTRMYRSFVIDRTDEIPYRYRVNHHGVGVVEEWAAENNSQQSLPESDHGSGAEPADPDPWDGTGLNRAQYMALQVVRDSDGGPKQSEQLSEAYADRGYDEFSNGRPTVGPRLSELYKKEYVGRTPSQPYYYWLTDKGEDLLNG